MTTNTLAITPWRCQFCHGATSETARVLAGDSGFICEACVQRCVAALGEHPGKAETDDDVGLRSRLEQHFAPQRPEALLTTSRSFPIRQQADLQKALDDLLGERRIPENFVGVFMRYGGYESLTFARVLTDSRGDVQAAPAQYEEIEIGRDETVRCLKNGLWLLREGDMPYVVVLGISGRHGEAENLSVEVVASPGDAGLALCERIFGALERQLSKDSCYRGRVLSLDQPYAWSGHASRIVVHDLDAVERDDLVLPEATLQALERNVIAFAAQRPALKQLGLSTQKGLLFHGAPGTGKTHCVRYLAGQLPDHTTLLITAEGVALLPEYMALARLLQPALVVIEDADLIARDRVDQNTCGEVMLNRLLNELDGLREQADVFFIMTTNRPDSLEPALASRPGRIDQAILFPLPDEALRARLIRLYGGALPIDDALIGTLAQRTEQASPAFIKEFMRRIAQHHLESGSDGPVTTTLAEAALHEMLFSGGQLNKALLGREQVIE